MKAVRVDIDVKYNEFDLVCIDIFSSCLPTGIIAGYRPPSSDTSAESVEYTKHFIDRLTSVCNVDLFIAFIADLNFPSIDWSNLKFVAENERCSTLFSIFSKQHCFEQLVGESTYLSPTGNGSLLDVILCNDPFIISDVTVSSPFSISDHCAVNFKIISSSRSSTLPAHESRDFSNAN